LDRNLTPFISGLTKSGIFVTLNEIPVEGMIPLRNITDDFYVFREEDFMITGRQNRRKFILGDKIRVRLTASDIDTMRIDFEPAELSKNNARGRKDEKSIDCRSYRIWRDRAHRYYIPPSRF
jgi:DNA-directed RNA polymerase subunit E'/Rpb7